MKWYKQAACLGDPKAQVEAGCCYAEGRGALRDYNEAFYWFWIAAELGNPDALKSRDKLSKKLNSQTIEKTKERARGMLHFINMINGNTFKR